MRKHSAAMLAYWRRIRRHARKHGFTIRETRKRYREDAVHARRAAERMRRGFG